MKAASTSYGEETGKQSTSKNKVSKMQLALTPFKICAPFSLRSIGELVNPNKPKSKGSRTKVS